MDNPSTEDQRIAPGPLALAALGRALAKVGQRRDIEEWQNIGDDLVAKAKQTSTGDESKST